MDFSRIELEHLSNTRDLGGIPAADGRRILPKRLIRSGALFGASRAELETLRDAYGVRDVIDLRMPMERENEPDPGDAGFRLHALSLLDDSFFGIARDAYSVNTWLSLFQEPTREPDEVFCEMYRKLLFDARVKPLYRRFFEILLQSEGAVLWHCSAGKDRAGVAALLTLTALGATEDTAVADYLFTGACTAADVAAVKRGARLRTRDPYMLAAVDTLMTAKEVYVRQLFRLCEKNYGGMTEYMLAAGILTKEEIRSLREKYLERGTADEKQ